MAGSTPLAAKIRRLFLVTMFAAAALAAAALSGAAGLAAAGQTPHPPAPVKEFLPWAPWTAALDFNILGCRMQIADMNGDGRSDLVCPKNFGDKETTYIQFSGGGSYGDWAVQGQPGQNTINVDNCLRVFLADANSDGVPDLICPYWITDFSTATFIKLSAGIGGGAWLLWGANTPGSTFMISRCAAIQVGDINGDGRADLICAYNYGGQETRTFVQFSTGASFSPWTIQNPTFQTGFDLARCEPLTSADVNADGRTDLICAYDYEFGATATFVQLSAGAGGQLWEAWSAKTPLYSLYLTSCRALQVGDVNGDGLDDLICPYDYDNGKTRTFVQLSNGSSFSDWTTLQTDLVTGFDLKKCVELPAGDVNGDGLDDLVCPYYYESGTNATFVQLSSGPGFADWQQWSAKTTNSPPYLEFCEPLLLGDAGGNGLSDLICPAYLGKGFTRTYVQRAQFYRSALPLVINQ